MVRVGSLYVVVSGRSGIRVLMIASVTAISSFCTSNGVGLAAPAANAGCGQAIPWSCSSSPLPRHRWIGMPSVSRASSPAGRLALQLRSNSIGSCRLGGAESAFASRYCSFGSTRGGVSLSHEAAPPPNKSLQATCGQASLQSRLRSARTRLNLVVRPLRGSRR